MTRVNNTKGRLLREPNAIDGTIPGFTGQFFDNEGYAHEVRPDDPYPTGDYGMTEGGVWIPKKVSDDGTTLTQVTGSIVEYLPDDLKKIKRATMLNAGILSEYYSEGVAYHDFVIDESDGIQESYIEQRENYLMLHGYAEDIDTPNESVAMTTGDKVDLTDVNKLYIDWSVETKDFISGNMRFRFTVSSYKDVSGGSYNARISHILSDGESLPRTKEVLNVSALDGEYYLATHINTLGGGRGANIRIYGLWGEK